jgi:chromosome segregation ATPase
VRPSGRGHEARAEADHAKADQVRMARDVATMFDELKALADRHAEMHADRARLQAGVDRLAAELEQAQRPWWRRLLGR